MNNSMYQIIDDMKTKILLFIFLVMGISHGYAQNIEINETNFPDDYFRNYLLTTNYEPGLYTRDGVITPEEMAQIKVIGFVPGLNGDNVTELNLKGIELFTSLELLNLGNLKKLVSVEGLESASLLHLNAMQTDLTSLDVSKCPSLTYLNCYANELTSLDVSKNTALTELRCEGNNLTSLDVTKNTALTKLWCYNNNLTSLDVSTNTALTELDCYNNSLTSLDVSKCTALQTLRCDNNQLTSLDVSKCTALQTLRCYNNNLTSLDMSKCTALTTLDCFKNQLISLDVTKNTALLWLDCCDNELTSLDVSTCTSLTTLRCNSNQLISLDVSKNAALTTLYCENNQLTSLDLSTNPQLTTLHAQNNELLQYLNISGCKITSLSTTGLISLEEIDASNSKITSITMGEEDLRKLRKLNVSNSLISRIYSKSPESSNTDYEKAWNVIEEINAEGCTNLTELHCYSSYLTSLNLKGCTKLKQLVITNGRLTSDSINLEGCSSLNRILMHRHRLSDLDFISQANATNLTELHVNGGKYNRQQWEGAGDDYFVHSNSIREIDMSKIPEKLEIFWIRHNLLKQLTIKNHGNIRQININNNMLWCADLSGLQAVQATTKKGTQNTTSSQQGTLTTNYLAVRPQTPHVDLQVEKGSAPDGSQDEVRLYIPDDTYDDFNNDQLKLSSIQVNGAYNKATFVDDGQKKYFKIASVAGGLMKDYDMYNKKNAFTYKYDTQAMSDPERVTNSYVNKYKEYDTKTRVGVPYTVEELINNFQNARQLDVQVTTYPYIMYVNPATKSRSDINYYSGTLWLDYHSIVPEGAVAYIATGIKKGIDNGGSEAGNQLNLVPIGYPGQIIPAGTAIYVRADTKAGLYAFHKAWEHEFIGWDGEETTSQTTDTLAYERTMSPERQAELDAQIAKIGNRNILQGSGTPIDFGAPRKVLILGIESQKGTNMIGFWPYNGTVVPAHRCYITEETYNQIMGAGNQSAQGMSFHFEDDNTNGTTGISDMESTTTSKDTWYTLNGVKLQGRPIDKGVYIHNGKQEVIR